MLAHKKYSLFLGLLFILFSFSVFSEETKEQYPRQTILSKAAEEELAKLKRNALLSIKNNKNQEALVMLKKAIEIAPYDLDAIFNYALVNKNLAVYEESLRTLEYLLNLDYVENRDLAYMMKGQIFEKQSMYREALEQFSLAYRHNSSNHEVLFEMGNVYLDIGLYRDAIASYNVAIERSPNNPYYYFNRALSYDRQGKYREALADYTKVINLKTESPYAYVHAGIIFYNNGKYETSLEYFDKAIELNIYHYESFYNRALSYYKLGKYDAALADLDMVLAIAPDNQDSIKLMKEIENKRFKINVKK